MTMLQCSIVFVIVCIVTIALYVYLYHFKKKQMLAIITVSISIALLLLSIIFVLPFPHRAEIIEAKVSPMHIEKRGANYYVVCDDEDVYKIKSTNTSVTSGFNSYANDEMYSNVKVDVTYRYNYKIWWIIPAYDIKYDTDIYFDIEWFSNLYGCTLDKNPRNIK